MFQPPSPPQPKAVPDADVEAYALERSLQSLVMLASATAPRSLQPTLGGSEIGYACDRRITYRLAGTAPTNFRDPLRALMGSAFHLQAADMFRQLDHGSGRFLTEHRVSYRGIPGTVDLYDRWTHTVIDWKTCLKKKLVHLRNDGPTRPYTVQVQLYAAALRAAGEDVKRVALAFVPVDGELTDTWVWLRPFDAQIADDAIDRIEALRGQRPENVRAVADQLCGWCNHYRPDSTDLSVGCPGKTV